MKEATKIVNKKLYLVFDFSPKEKYNPIFDSWKVKNGCEASKIKAYSRFLFRIDMCYCAIFLHYGKFISFVCLMMLRIIDFLMNS